MERESSVAQPVAELLKQYSGAVAWAIERDAIHTRVNLVAAAFTRNARGPFQLHLTLYTDRRPDGITWVSAKAQFDRDLRVRLADAFPEEAAEGFEGYVEVVATSPNQELRPQHYNELWFDYASDDGRVHGILPTIQFYGSLKRTLGGQSQIWPGVIADHTFRPSIIAINPYSEPVEFELAAIEPSGSRFTSAPIALEARRQRRWLLADLLPDLVEWLRPHGGIGNLLVTSNHKMICYFMIENAVTGTVTGMDHLAWFYGENF